jgi:hypothetical protein
VEMDAGAQMKGVSEWIGRAPRVGEVTVEIHLIAFKEAAEEQAVDLLGLRVCGEARVEIGGVGFDEKG